MRPSALAHLHSHSHFTLLLVVTVHTVAMKHQLAPICSFTQSRLQSMEGLQFKSTKKRIITNERKRICLIVFWLVNTTYDASACSCCLELADFFSSPCRQGLGFVNLGPAGRCEKLVDGIHIQQVEDCCSKSIT